MAGGVGGEPVECTLTGYCRTQILELPDLVLVSEDTVPPAIIFSDSKLRAAIVCDLLGYFEDNKANSLHYKIDVSLHSSVRNIYNNNEHTHKLFLVIEEFSKFTPTVLSDEQCFMIDEVRDKVPLIEGGREGYKAITAFRVSGCPWPELNSMYSINVVVSAVKTTLYITGHITLLYECSCFVNDRKKVVYTLDPTMSATARLLTPMAPNKLKEKARRIKDMLHTMLSEEEPTAKELFDAIVLDKTIDDGYLRLAYLRIWEAVDDAKKYLGEPALWNNTSIGDNRRSPKELKEHRNDIAHWNKGRIDHSCLRDLELTAIDLLRKKYVG